MKSIPPRKSVAFEWKMVGDVMTGKSRCRLARIEIVKKREFEYRWKILRPMKEHQYDCLTQGVAATLWDAVAMSESTTVQILRLVKEEKAA